MALSDRIAVMREGAIAQFDTPARLYDAPASPARALWSSAPKMPALPPITRMRACRAASSRRLSGPLLAAGARYRPGAPAA